MDNVEKSKKLISSTVIIVAEVERRFIFPTLEVPSDEKKEGSYIVANSVVKERIWDARTRILEKSVHPLKFIFLLFGRNQNISIKNALAISVNKWLCTLCT